MCHHGRPAMGMLEIKKIPTLVGWEKGTTNEVIDKMSEQISRFVYKAWSSQYPQT